MMQVGPAGWQDPDDSIQTLAFPRCHSILPQLNVQVFVVCLILLSQIYSLLPQSFLQVIFRCICISDKRPCTLLNLVFVFQFQSSDLLGHIHRSLSPTLLFISVRSKSQRRYTITFPRQIQFYKLRGEDRTAANSGSV